RNGPSRMQYGVSELATRSISGQGHMRKSWVSTTKSALLLSQLQSVAILGNDLWCGLQAALQKQPLLFPWMRLSMLIATLLSATSTWTAVICRLTPVACSLPSIITLLKTLIASTVLATA